MPEQHYKSDFLKKFNHIYVGNLPLYINSDLYTHDFYLLVYIARGNGIHRVMMHDIPVYEGDIILTNPKVRHCIYCREGERSGFYYCCFTKELFPEICQQFEFDFPQLSSFFSGSTPYLHISDNVQKMIRNHFIRLIDDFVHIPAGYEYTLKSNLILILTQMFRTYCHKDSEQHVSYSNEIVDLTILYIKRNIHTKISLDELAEDRHVTKIYLCKLFKKYIGKTITQFINIQRTEEIKDFLQCTDRPINMIAEDFHMNTAYLNRVFKENTNYTMVEYRKKYHFKVHS